MPKRVQMTRNKPWRKDNPDAVIVSRFKGNKWGNPWKIGMERRRELADGGVVWERCESNADAARFFSEMLEIEKRNYPSNDEIRRELTGKDLACWCPLDQPCHADVLLELANEGKVE